MAGPGTGESIADAVCGVEGVSELRGDLDATGLRFALVVGRFHTGLTRGLANTILNSLIAHGAQPRDIKVVWVPGTFETSGVIEKLAAGGQYDALIALGAVVEGETSHAATIVSAVAASLCATISRHGTPIIDGIVAAPSLELAEKRCLPGPHCRGPYLAEAAIETARLYAGLDDGGADGQSS